MAPTLEGDVPNTDMILVLSSELVCQLAEKYFNSTMLKQKVTVIDLQVANNGLIQFMLQFKKKEEEELPPLPIFPLPKGPDIEIIMREMNGRFKKKELTHG